MSLILTLKTGEPEASLGYTARLSPLPLFPSPHRGSDVWLVTFQALYGLRGRLLLETLFVPGMTLERQSVHVGQRLPERFRAISPSVTQLSGNP